MKKLFITLVMLAILGLSANFEVWGQAASSTWALTSNAIASISGNVSATSATEGSSIGTPSYGAKGIYATGWTTNNSIDVNGYYQYTISPTSGNNLTVTSISLIANNNGPVYQYAAVYYSLDNFSTSTALGTNIKIFGNTPASISYTPSITIPNGSTLTLRVYGYWSDGASYYFYNLNVVISGTTSSCTDNTGDTSAIACNSFSWYGTTFTATGTPTKVLTNAGGCDSTVTLHLTVNNSSTGDTTAIACNSFSWYGTTYTATGTPTYPLTNSVGCDSTVTLHLTINHSSSGDTTAIACNSFSWYGTAYTATGTPTYPLTNSVGCDSIVTLHLTINHSSSGDTTAIACNSFSWYGTTYTATGTPTFPLTNSVGCDSIVTLHLTINHSSVGDTTTAACGSFTWYGNTYITSGTHTNTFTNAVNCDSIVTLHLTVNPIPSTPTISQYSNYFLSNSLSGNQWYYNGNPISGATSIYYTATATGCYYCIVTGTGGCVSDTSNTICVSFAGLTELSDNNNINLYPNPATNNITIESPLQATIEITNIEGQLIKSIATTGNKTNVDISGFAKEMYFVKVKTEKTVESKKFVKL